MYSPRLIRPALGFLAIFASLQTLYAQSRDTWMERWLIDLATVRPSAFLIDLITPAAGVEARGHSLVSATTRLNILNGCEGLETLFLLISAILVYPASWPHKLKGAVLGAFLVYALNQVRIVTLYYAFVHDHALFSLLHGIVLPLVLIALSGLFFLAWIDAGRSVRHETA